MNTKNEVKKTEPKLTKKQKIQARIEDLQKQLANERKAEQKKLAQSFDTIYRDYAKYDLGKKNVESLNLILNNIKQDLENNKISQVAHDRYKKLVQHLIAVKGTK